MISGWSASAKNGDREDGHTRKFFAIFFRRNLFHGTAFRPFINLPFVRSLKTYKAANATPPRGTSAFRFDWSK